MVSHYDKFQKNTEINRNLLSKLFSLIKKEIKNSDAVIVCDYGYAPLTNKINELLKKYAEKIPILISTTDENYMNFKDSKILIKINRTNAQILTKQFFNNKKSKKMVKEISKILNLKEVLLTVAEDGVIILNEDVILEIPATQHMRIDPKGIGEIMLAAMGMSLLKSNDFIEACKIGNIAAGLAVSKGFSSNEIIYTITLNELKTAIREYENWLNEK